MRGATCVRVSVVVLSSFLTSQALDIVYKLAKFVLLHNICIVVFLYETVIVQ